MKSASGALVAAIAAETTYLCRLWDITINGTTLYFTDSPVDVIFDDQTWTADPGIEISAIQQTADGGVQNATVKIALGTSSFSEGDIRSGALDGAAFNVYTTDWTAPDTYGAVLFFSGITGQITFTDTQWCEIDITGNLTNATTSAGEAYSKTCRAQLGDSRCQYDIESAKYTAAVETVDVSNLYFSSATLIGPTDGFFTLGTVHWLTGDNTGFYDDVASFDTVTGIIGFALTPRYLIQVGDTFDIYPGCDFQAITCKNKFNNLIHFRGEALAPPPNANPLSNVDWGTKTLESV